jgi:uncharacterized membrane protein
MKYIPSSFRWPAILAMTLTTAAATVANARLVATGFWNWRGLPFKWYEWHDFGPPFDHYYWRALAADIIIAAAVVFVVGVAVERLSRHAQSDSSQAA